MTESKPWPIPWNNTVGKEVKTAETHKYEIEGADVVQLVPKSEITTSQQQPWGFKKGVSGNPAGRPKGSKHKITELARTVILNDFEEHGAATLARVRAMDPVSYMQIVLKMVPRELILQREKGLVIDYAELSDEEFGKIYAEAERRKLIEHALDHAGKRR